MTCDYCDLDMKEISCLNIIKLSEPGGACIVYFLCSVCYSRIKDMIRIELNK